MIIIYKIKTKSINDQQSYDKYNINLYKSTKILNFNKY